MQREESRDGGGYHMLPVMSSAPRGRLRALSAYSLRGRSPGEASRNRIRSETAFWG